MSKTCTQEIKHLTDAIQAKGGKVTFGLQPHQIKAIEDELKRFGNREVNAKYVKYIWEKLGKELAWEPFTLALYYFEYLEELSSSRHQENDDLITDKRRRKMVEHKKTYDFVVQNKVRIYQVCRHGDYKDIKNVPETVQLIRYARQQIGYSDKTWSGDIFTSLVKLYKKICG